MNRERKAKPTKLTFSKWLRTLPDTVIWKLAKDRKDRNEWRRDVKRDRAIRRVFDRRLKREA